MIWIHGKFSAEPRLVVPSYETVSAVSKSGNMLPLQPPVTFLFQERPPYNPSYFKCKLISDLKKATIKQGKKEYLQGYSELLPGQRAYHKHKELLLLKERPLSQ